MNAILAGALGMASLVAALFFLRFWRTTRDRFFLFFSLAFFIEGVNRLLIGASVSEDAPTHYIPRLVAYGLILWAILDKNRKGRPPR